MCWVSNHCSPVGNVFENNGSCTYGNMITYMDITKYRSASIDLDIVTNSGASVLAIAQSHQLQTIEVFSNRFCIQISSVGMFQVCTFAYRWTPDVTGPFGRKEPFYGCRPIIAKPVVEQIPEASLPCARFDEIGNRGLLVLNFLQIGSNLLFEQ